MKTAQREVWLSSAWWPSDLAHRIGLRMKPPDIERLVVQSFFDRNRRERFLYLLSIPRRRHKALEVLAHNKPFDSRFLHPIQAATAVSPPDVYDILTGLGSPPECYAISCDSELDARFLPLHDALARSILWPAGTILSCIHGRLGYYEGEDPGERYLLRRPSSP